MVFVLNGLGVVLIANESRWRCGEEVKGIEEVEEVEDKDEHGKSERVFARFGRRVGGGIGYGESSSRGGCGRVGCGRKRRAKADSSLRSE
jgi:hypothetical protein